MRIGLTLLLFISFIAVLASAVSSSFAHGSEQINLSEVSKKDPIGKVVDVPVGSGGLWVVETEEGTYTPVEPYRHNIYNFSATEELYRYVHGGLCYIGNNEGTVVRITCNNFY